MEECYKVTKKPVFQLFHQIRAEHLLTTGGLTNHNQLPLEFMITSSEIDLQQDTPVINGLEVKMDMGFLPGQPVFTLPITNRMVACNHPPPRKVAVLNQSFSIKPPLLQLPAGLIAAAPSAQEVGHQVDRRVVLAVVLAVLQVGLEVADRRLIDRIFTGALQIFSSHSSHSKIQVQIF